MVVGVEVFAETWPFPVYLKRRLMSKSFCQLYCLGVSCQRFSLASREWDYQRNKRMKHICGSEVRADLWVRGIMSELTCESCSDLWCIHRRLAPHHVLWAKEMSMHYSCSFCFSYSCNSNRNNNANKNTTELPTTKTSNSSIANKIANSIADSNNLQQDLQTIKHQCTSDK